MKASEIFEGENSPLRKAFDEATQPNEFVEKLALETLDRIECQLKYGALQGEGRVSFATEDIETLNGIIKSVIAAAHAEGAREAIKEFRNVVSLYDYEWDGGETVWNEHLIKKQHNTPTL